MKKIVITSIIIMLMLVMLPSSVYAKDIISVNATPSENKVTVSGKAETGVLAVAVLAYSGDNLTYMETCNVDDNQNYSCTLNHSFEKGTYDIKVADYEGGAYKSTSITIEEKEENTKNTENTENKITTNNPQTSDNIRMYINLFILSAGGFAIATLQLKKRRKLAKNN